MSVIPACRNCVSALGKFVKKQIKDEKSRRKKHLDSHSLWIHFSCIATKLFVSIMDGMAKPQIKFDCKLIQKLNCAKAKRIFCVAIITNQTQIDKQNSSGHHQHDFPSGKYNTHPSISCGSNLIFNLFDNHTCGRYHDHDRHQMSLYTHTVDFISREIKIIHQDASSEEK